MTRTLHALRKLRPLAAVAFAIVLLAQPARVLRDHYTPGIGFLRLIYFGQEFQDRALPVVREQAKRGAIATTPYGYDGQFYAQIAVCPLLSDPALERAVDGPRYRAQRIGLPALAWCLGLSRPAAVLHVYALINIVFWLVLMAALWRFVGFRTPRDMALAVALLWTTGTQVCLERALTDFPAAALGVLALFVTSRWLLAAGLLSGAALVRETSVLSFAAVPWREDAEGTGGVDVTRSLLAGLIVVLPLAAWVVYVRLRLLSGGIDFANNFWWPLFGLANKLTIAARMLAERWPGAIRVNRFLLLTEVLAPVSLAVQAGYLFARPRVRSRAWRFGIGFAALLVVLGTAVWTEQYAYTRALLPLTFAFNLLIHRHEKGAAYWALLVLGNGGLCWMALWPLMA